MSIFKKRALKRTRDAPKTLVALSSAANWDIIFESGYVPLYSCPEVAMCVDAIADLVSSMTLHLLETAGGGDRPIVNG